MTCCVIVTIRSALSYICSLWIVHGSSLGLDVSVTPSGVQMLHCSMCGTSVHQLCYGVLGLPPLWAAHLPGGDKQGHARTCALASAEGRGVGMCADGRMGRAHIGSDASSDWKCSPCLMHWQQAAEEAIATAAAAVAGASAAASDGGGAGAAASVGGGGVGRREAARLLSGSPAHLLRWV